MSTVEHRGDRCSLPLGEEYISLQHAGKIWGYSYTTMQKFRKEGQYGVKLRTVKLGYRRKTTREWMDNFVRECTALTERRLADPEQD